MGFLKFGIHSMGRTFVLVFKHFVNKLLSRNIILICVFYEIICGLWMHIPIFTFHLSPFSPFVDNCPLTFYSLSLPLSLSLSLSLSHPLQASLLCDASVSSSGSYLPFLRHVVWWQRCLGWHADDASEQESKDFEFLLQLLPPAAAAPAVQGIIFRRSPYQQRKQNSAAAAGFSRRDVVRWTGVVLSINRRNKCSSRLQACLGREKCQATLAIARHSIAPLLPSSAAAAPPPAHTAAPAAAPCCCCPYCCSSCCPHAVAAHTAAPAAAPMLLLLSILSHSCSSISLAFAPVPFLVYVYVRISRWNLQLPQRNLVDASVSRALHSEVGDRAVGWALVLAA